MANVGKLADLLSSEGRAFPAESVPHSTASELRSPYPTCAGDADDECREEIHNC